MNNTINFFGFPKVKWLQYTGEVAKCTSHCCQIFPGLNTQKSLKLFTIWQSYLKNKKVDTFWDTVSVIHCVSKKFPPLNTL